MRCSWVEKNGRRNIIDWERTKNDVGNVVSLLSGNLVHTSTSGGRSGLGVVDLLGWLSTTIVVVASGTGWSILILDLILGTLTRIVACLTTLVTGSENSAWSWVVWWSWVELGWWTRRHIGWPRWVVLAEHVVWDPDLALLGTRTGWAIISRVFAKVIEGVHVLGLDGFVDKDLESGKVVKDELTTKSRVEATTEPVLFLGVGGDFFNRITSKSIELTTKLINSPSALGEVAELLTLAVHKTFGDVVLAEGSAEFLPSGGWSNGTHIQKVLPPRTSCTFKVIGGIVDLVAICNMACLELPFDAAKPVIGVKGLSGVTENRGMKSDEVVQ